MPPSARAHPHSPQHEQTGAYKTVSRALEKLTVSEVSCRVEA
jgi:hypothetical protein